MAGRGRPKAVLELTDREREQLAAWARGEAARSLATRSRIVLACASGLANTQVSRQVGVSATTVGKWRARFVDDRLGGLADRPRPGRQRMVDRRLVESIVVSALEVAPPHGATHWSTRMMAAKTGVSQSTVSRVWRDFGLKPHRVEHRELCQDPQVAKMVRDALGLVPGSSWRVQESSRARVLERSHAMSRGGPQRAADAAGSHPTSGLLAALDTATTKIIGARHRGAEVRKLLRKIDGELTARKLSRRPRRKVEHRGSDNHR